MRATHHPLRLGASGPLFAGLILAAWLGCGAEPPASPAAPDPDPATARPNLLLISLDTLRADHLSAYGYERRTSPFLEELAAEGVRVRDAFANTLTTKSSHTTIFTSLYQETHRVEHGLRDGVESKDPLPRELTLLPERLRDAGYVTLGVTDGLFLSRRFGFERGFQDFDDAGGGIASGAKKLLEMIRRSRPGDAPIFAFLHTYETHSPYRPPPRDAEDFTDPRHRIDTSTESLIRFANRARALEPEQLDYVRGSYDAEIRHTDRELRGFFEALESDGFFRNHLVVVTSDHGEEFGEHGGLLHRGLLYDEFTRVPLILRGTGVAAGVVDESLASSLDIAPTLLAFAGIAIPGDMQGRNLLAPTRGTPGASAPEDPELVFSQFRRWRYAVRSPDWKLIESHRPRRSELYDLRADPGETTNVADRHPARVFALRSRLEDWRASQTPLEAEPQQGAPLDPEERRRLRELGYLIDESAGPEK